MRNITILAIAAFALIFAACSQNPEAMFPPDMTCEQLEVKRVEAERKYRTAATNAGVNLDQRDLMGDVHARSNQGDDEWRRQKDLRRAKKLLEDVESVIEARSCVVE